MSVQTLDQRRAELLKLRAAVDAEIARVEGAIKEAARKVRLRGPDQTRRRSRFDIPPCGSETAYQRHRHQARKVGLKGVDCQPCLDAHATHVREREAERRRIAGAQEWRAS